MEDVLRILVPIAGAAIVIGFCMVKGLLLHKIVARHAPALALPSDLVVLVAAAIGVWIVMG